MKYGFLALVWFSSVTFAQGSIDLVANEQPVTIAKNQQAIDKIPADYRFIEPGTLTVAITALNSPTTGNTGQ